MARRPIVLTFGTERLYVTVHTSLVSIPTLRYDCVKLVPTDECGCSLDGFCAIRFFLMTDEWRLLPGTVHPEHCEAVVQGFLDQCPADEKWRLQKQHAETIEEKAKLMEFTILPEELESKAYVFWSDVVTNRRGLQSGGSVASFEFSHDGVDYAVEDGYVADPRRRCSLVALAFHRLDPVSRMSAEELVTIRVQTLKPWRYRCKGLRGKKLEAARDIVDTWLRRMNVCELLLHRRWMFQWLAQEHVKRRKAMSAPGAAKERKAVAAEPPAQRRTYRQLMNELGTAAPAAKDWVN